ncbi:T9SS type A sorting domain-containing protein [Mangrovibacterium diazotrophicum]|uniref:Putative secreted protein (Por secretion system target) n=1 Tax=Mangrovibacterium diazotrophicum TaxID=1261403 RepID=A0A419W8A2_9BACT|nr:T9SS type A sorting domain-containing protein [Mangrovibacterium diazotrophicum]RKD91592.1 putative secreted protein (Por secretion system target) [Mangrovibacterium diazotrophicum]
MCKISSICSAFLVSIICLVFINTSVAQKDLLWNYHYDDGLRTSRDYLLKSFLTGNNEIIFTGRLEASFTNTDFISAKISENGKILWETQYSSIKDEADTIILNYDGGGINSQDIPVSSYLDKDENLYSAVILEENFNNGYFSQDVAVMKQDRQGNILWKNIFYRQGIDFAVDDIFRGFYVDSLGNSWLLTHAPIDSPAYSLVKYDNAGNQIFVSHFDLPENTDYSNAQLDLIDGKITFVSLHIEVGPFLIATFSDIGEIEREYHLGNKGDVGMGARRYEKIWFVNFPTGEKAIVGKLWYWYGGKKYYKLKIFYFDNNWNQIADIEPNSIPTDDIYPHNVSLCGGNIYINGGVYYTLEDDLSMKPFILQYDRNANENLIYLNNTDNQGGLVRSLNVSNDTVYLTENVFDSLTYRTNLVRLVNTSQIDYRKEIGVNGYRCHPENIYKTNNSLIFTGELRNTVTPQYPEDTNSEQWVASYNEEGTEQWSVTNTGTGASDIQFEKVISDRFNNSYVCGDSQIGPIGTGTSYFENQHLLLQKIDALGNLAWSRRISTDTTKQLSYRSEYMKLLFDKDGNILLSGFSSLDIYVYKFSPEGDLFAKNIIETEIGTLVRDIHIDSKNNIYLYLPYYSKPSQIIKLSSDLNELWRFNFEEELNRDEPGFFIEQDNGEIDFISKDGDLIEISENGILKSRTEISEFESINHVRKTKEGTFFLTGTIESGYRDRIKIVEIDSTGKILWEHSDNNIAEGKYSMDLPSGDLVVFGGSDDASIYLRFNNKREFCYQKEYPPVKMTLICEDSLQNLLLTDNYFNNAIMKIAPNGDSITSYQCINDTLAANLQITDIKVDANNNPLVSGYTNNISSTHYYVWSVGTVAKFSHPESINQPPLFVKRPELENFSNPNYRDTLLAVDPDGDSITYSIEQGPDWLAVTDDGILSRNDNYSTDSLIIFRATDSHGAFDRLIMTYALESTTDISTDVNTLSNGSFIVYPNPSNGILHLKLQDNNQNKKCNVEIYDMKGNVVYNKILSANSTAEYNINLSSLSSGHYVLMINGDRNFSCKVILQ